MKSQQYKVRKYFSEDSCESLKLKSSQMLCYTDIENFFLKKEILNVKPDVLVMHDVFSETEVQDILDEARGKQLMHMFEIYKEYIEDLEADVDWTNFNISGRTLTKKFRD